MENLFVFIIYNVFCMRFIDQLVKEPLVFSHLSHCLSLSIHQILSVNCVCVCAGVADSTQVLRMCVRRKRCVSIRCKQAVLWPRQVSLITVCLS